MRIKMSSLDEDEGEDYDKDEEGDGLLLWHVIIM